MQLALNTPPTFREMSDLFDLMRELNPADLQRCANEKPYANVSKDSTTSTNDEPRMKRSS